MARQPLPHPPSDRYGRQPGRGGGEVAPPAAPKGAQSDVEPLAIVPGRRGAVLAGIAAAVTAALISFLMGVLGTTIGTLFTAGVGGWLVGGLLAGLRTSARRRTRLAVGLAIAAVLVGGVGSWLLAASEGGTLGLLDFLWATSGVLIPAAVVVAGLAAVVGVRAGYLPT